MLVALPDYLVKMIASLHPLTHLDNDECHVDCHAGAGEVTVRTVSVSKNSWGT